MSNQPLLDVQEGIWSEQHSSELVDDLWTEEVINIFCSLGKDAQAGQLKDTSINHDFYLYSKASVTFN
jgi:hypothetical protein